jgi:hypothetical protein
MLRKFLVFVSIAILVFTTNIFANEVSETNIENIDISILNGIATWDSTGIATHYVPVFLFEGSHVIGHDFTQPVINVWASLASLGVLDYFNEGLIELRLLAFAGELETTAFAVGSIGLRLNTNGDIEEANLFDRLVGFKLPSSNNLEYIPTFIREDRAFVPFWLVWELGLEPEHDYVGDIEIGFWSIGEFWLPVRRVAEMLGFYVNFIEDSFTIEIFE